MSQSVKPSLFFLFSAITIAVVCFLAFLLISDGIKEPSISPINACFNNMREIDVAKNKWALEHHAKTNDVVALNDIKHYFPRYRDPGGFIKLDANGNLPECPSGGIYTIGKIGESPTCSIGTSVTPPHILP